ncbi:hypothetical protein BD780_002473 [Clostridium tetanomorphum]|uniref:Uncharacterized protein n=1 Tax=Clostridium tetanomorphum TaxID=1553 RepID=A0A923ED89_CLOTT|nr:hypothetical protein [Clostridium tetanomorphum]KAJ53446.1 hypothetical protein CTM_02314 [Clostridium tetanomorphum DSM 665]MBC2398480.1 hypothetical protein [Clostridium tetanomorphum]MBP1865325.1 hypothetical protein [Clostridium tetanomorphum]NRS85248.1 hypothetical protein [Clostridium tetanomorphum]NRZ98425.1 hypothetical protein [Clostridium tetanomorphum]
MTSIVVQYVLIVFLVVGIGYLLYLLKDKGIQIKDDYFGITLSLLNTLSEDEATPENTKKILRCISKAVNYIEVNYKNAPNDIKEAKAFEMAKELIISLNLNSSISDESIRYLIRLSAAFLPPKNEE